MSIKPIDLQTSMTQMLEVGKGEQAKSIAVAEQQHIREKESNEKSRLINTRLDESKKADKTSIRDENNRNRQKYKKDEKDRKENAGDNPEKDTIRDDRIGRIIDVLK